jgi:GntR family transcriptional repressor for pyruvate dehydrogenase complex
MRAEKILTIENFKRSPAPKPLHAQVVEQIQQLIKNGELNPGDQLLPERELAEKLGVSRTSVRKAVARLEGMGIIAVTPRDGAYVRRRSLEDAVEPLTQILFQEREKVTHQFEVRQMLETQAVRWAAQRRDEADLQVLRELNQQFEAGLRRGEVAFEANARFHIAIVKAAKNPILTEISVALLTAAMEVYASARRRSFLDAPDSLRFVTEHEQIIQAITQQEPDLAAKLMAKHIDDARHRIEVAADNKSLDTTH